MQPAPVVKCGDSFVAYLKTLPASQRPKTAAYPSLDDPFSSPIADAMQSQFEKMGVKTVYKTIYPAETTDMTPIIAKAIAKKPEMIVAGTQSEDAYGQVKALVQAGYNPKFLFFANGANSPTEFPSKVGAKNVNGIFSCSDWTPAAPTSGNALFVQQYLKKYGGSKFDIDNNSSEAWAVGQLLQLVAKKTGSIDNQKIITALHSGTLADDRGQPLLERSTASRTARTCSSSGSTASCCPCSRRRSRSRSRSPRSRPGADRTGDRRPRCISSSKPASWACSPAGCTP